MNFRGLIVAVVVLATLGGVLYWSQHHKPAEESAAVPTSTAPVILKVDPADMTELVIKQKEPVTLKKTNGKWQIIEPKSYPADQEAVAGVLSTLSGLNADRIVDEKATDRKQYGLEPAQVELDISSKSGATQRLLLGDDTVAGGNVYAALVTDPRLFTIASYNKNSLAKTLNDLRDKSLVTLSADKVSRVELLRKGEDLEFDRTKDGWQILKPSSSPADSSAVNALVSTLTNARMDLSTTSDAAAAFARATPLATAKVTGDAGVQTLEVRKNKDDYFAKSSAVEGIYKVDSSVGQGLDKKIDDFRQKKPAATPAPAAK
jgi:Domain of unknown function (DUF4340)